MSASSSLADRELLTLKEAADFGYAAVPTLRMYIRDGRLPAQKVGNRVKVRRADLDRLVRPRQGRPPAESFERLEYAIANAIAAAPPLTDDQRARVISLLGVPELKTKESRPGQETEAADNKLGGDVVDDTKDTPSGYLAASAIDADLNHAEQSGVA